MELMVSDLLKRFECGKITRRELVQALALVAVAGRTASAAGLKPAASITCQCLSAT